MTKSVFQKLDIAKEYLNCAIRMHLDQQSYFCAIHLAGAAWELLDYYLPEKERTWNIVWKGQKALHWSETGHEPSKREIKDVIIGSKNALKHIKKSDETVIIDLIFEAEWYINHALNSFEKLRLPKSVQIWRYQDYQSSKIRSLDYPAIS